MRSVSLMLPTGIKCGFKLVIKLQFMRPILFLREESSKGMLLGVVSAQARIYDGT